MMFQPAEFFLRHGSELRMDFNQAFKAYDNVDGALCQTTLPRHISQKEAAIETKKIENQYL